MAPRTLVQDLAILLARIGIGVVFVAHGWQKLVTNGMDATAAGFGQMGVPLPTLSAWFAALVELVGGAALILGAALPVAGVLLAVDMLGAYLFAHAGNGIFVGDGGAELVLALGVAALLFAAIGSGRFGVDDRLGSRLRRSPARTPA
ncbi:DoxX family protein [Polymorphospora rubra]|uniref:DoxX family protein n=1 Tax=Polymorphospora rubra TaxID=338584 RepID=A0A810N5Y9_9ACTN|nr:DoxX family protein [Polymorphospora rubra]BCJ69161.1 hypothetical protein Prubr_61820 [Polymorphospora rubra]